MGEACHYRLSPLGEPCDMLPVSWRHAGGAVARSARKGRSHRADFPDTPRGHRRVMRHDSTVARRMRSTHRLRHRCGGSGQAARRNGARADMSRRSSANPEASHRAPARRPHDAKSCGRYKHASYRLRRTPCAAWSCARTARLSHISGSSPTMGKRRSSGEARQCHAAVG